MPYTEARTNKNGACKVIFNRKILKTDMNNFNITRFKNVARWDLTINKSFYRNFAFVVSGTILAITLFGLFFRWILMTQGNPSDEFSTVGGTAMVIAYAIGIIMCVSAGCLLHNLRNKQGRISSLTLPATNLEKFLWHTLLMIVGMYVLCFASIVVCDGINALLSTLLFGAENVHSITYSYIQNAILLHSNAADFSTAAFGTIPDRIRNSIVLLSITGTILSFTVYAFGNSLKYKFNILFTLIVLYILQFILGVAFVVIAMDQAERVNDIDPETLLETMPTLLNIGSVLVLILSGVLWWASYRNYTRAQVTSKWNR